MKWIISLLFITISLNLIAQDSNSYTAPSIKKSFNLEDDKRPSIKVVSDTSDNLYYSGSDKEERPVKEVETKKYSIYQNGNVRNEPIRPNFYSFPAPIRINW